MEKEIINPFAHDKPLSTKAALEEHASFLGNPNDLAQALVELEPYLLSHGEKFLFTRRGRFVRHNRRERLHNRCMLISERLFVAKGNYYRWRRDNYFPVSPEPNFMWGLGEALAWIAHLSGHSPVRKRSNECFPIFHEAWQQLREKFITGNLKCSGKRVQPTLTSHEEISPLTFRDKFFGPRSEDYYGNNLYSYTEHEWQDVQFLAKDVMQTWPADRSKVKTALRKQNEFKQWLIQEMKASSDTGPRPKAYYVDIGIKNYTLTKRIAIMSWAEAVAESGSHWSRAGRKSTAKGKR